jgi:hypothetical protein
MQYEISVSDTCVSVVFEGKLEAIDFIFMNQDPYYRESIVGKEILFLDFSLVSGSELTNEDTQGIMLLGKLDSQKVKNIRLVILIATAGTQETSQLCEKVFSDSTWQVSVVDSRADALKLL